MAKQRPTDSGLPRPRIPGKALDDETPITPHPHTTPDGAEVHHRHKMGQLPHDHDDEGRPVLPGQATFKAARTEEPVAIESAMDQMVASGQVDEVTDVLPAAAPNTSGQATTDPSPPAIPRESGDALASSGVDLPPAGSEGGGAGRSSSVPAERARERSPASLIRPDASEKVLGAASSVINPAADPAFAIRHAEEQARVLIIGQHWAGMLKAVSPPAAQLVAEEDVRGMYHYLRLVAATHGIDLDDNGGDR
jgi:hypothetical protein